jgi:hypothetical protein
MEKHNNPLKPTVYACHALCRIAKLVPCYGGLIPPLRRQIDGRIEPYPFREKDFNISNPIVNNVVKYGQDININVA